MNTTISTGKQIEIEYLREQLKKVNAERAVAVKALQEIEIFLFAPKNDYEAIVKAYMTTSVALEKIEYPREGE